MSSQIVDAFGQMHSLSQNAFDAFSMQVPGLDSMVDFKNVTFQNAFNQLAGDSFDGTEVMKKFREYAPVELVSAIESAAQSLEVCH